MVYSSVTMTAEEFEISESAGIDAPPERVYNLIADYKNGHPQILPKAFHSLEVEQGGIGAGTIISCQLRVFARSQKFRSEIFEPEPGRILLERVLGSDLETTFTVMPVSPTRCLVTITTKMKSRSGILGKIKRFFYARLFRPIYQEELRLINEVATKI